MVLKVFVVEDSAAMRSHLIETLVAKASVNIVGVAETEKDAADWLGRNADHWDVALIDLFLREGTGAGVIEQCRQRRTGQCVLVMTNHARDAALLQHCKRIGADAVYQKATGIGDLVAHCLSLAAKGSHSVA